MEQTVSVLCRLTLDFPSPGGHNRSLSQFIIVSLSSACGFSERNLRIDQVSSRGEADKTNIVFHVTGDGYSECWAMVSKLRRAMGDSESTLHTIGHMKRVFNGSVLRVFHPPESERSGKVRYKVRAPNDQSLRASAPKSASGDIPRRLTARVVSDELILPSDPSHIPFDVVLVPSGTVPPESPVRHVNVVLPSPKQLDTEPVFQADTSSIDELLARIRPTLPSSLKDLQRLLIKSS